MKNLLIAVLVISTFAMVSCNLGNSKGPKVETASDSVAYALGVLFGQNLPLDFPDISPEDVSKQLLATFTGEEQVMFESQQEATFFIQKFLQKSGIDSTEVFSPELLDSVECAVGYYYGTNIINDFPEINVDITDKALVAAFNGEEQTIFADQNAAGMYIKSYMREKTEKENQVKYADNIKAEKEFLAANAQKAGVTVTESGLQYEVLREGDGPTPQSPTDKVRVTYHGTLLDGTVFDSSIERGDTVSFGLNQVIKGWTEGVQLMNVGSKYRFYVPAELAYGASPRPGGVIEPYMALIFDVELFGINEE